jgi:uncharacterized protein YbjT (DUF2867 family)
VVGDLESGDDVCRAAAGCRSAFYVSPHDADEVAMARTFVEACELTDVRIVFAGVLIAERNAVKRALFGLLFKTLLSHYQGKLEVASIIATSNTRPILLAPNNFMQNDEAFREDILAGEFAQPLAGVNRIDVRDVAEVAARALLDDEFTPGAYSLVGPETLSGPQCADVWASELGRPVRYVGSDREAWHAAFARNLTGHKRTDWEASFAMLGRLKVRASKADLETTRTLLGREPRRYAGYVHDMASAWLPQTEGTSPS